MVFEMYFVVFGGLVFFFFGGGVKFYSRLFVFLWGERGVEADVCDVFWWVFLSFRVFGGD